MSSNKKNVLRYSREELTGMGPSRVELFELENPGANNTINIDGKLVTIRPVKPESPMKPYVVIERYSNIDFITIDILYGDIDIPKLKKDENIRSVFFDKILSRENIEEITRRYFGLIPASVNVDPYGRKNFGFYDGYARSLSTAVLLSGYKEVRERKPENTTSKPKQKSFIESLFGSKKKQSTNLETYQGNSSEYQGEGVIFFRSGVVLLNKSKYLKFNYATQDDTTKGVGSDGKPKISNFIVSDFDEGRLRTDPEYMKKFVSLILSPERLKNARSVPGFPYVGGINDFGEFRYDATVWESFEQIRQRI